MSNISWSWEWASLLIFSQQVVDKIILVLFMNQTAIPRMVDFDVLDRNLMVLPYLY
jgi:hypothetical protein